MDAFIPQEVMAVMEEDEQSDHEEWLYSILNKIDLARQDGYLSRDEFATVVSEFGFSNTWRD